MAITERERYAEAASVGREALRRVRVLERTSPEIGSTEVRVLEAVVAFTALYSRFHDRLYLGELAAFAFGIEWAKPWMLKKTREALRELEKAGLVWSHPPAACGGRPPGRTNGPAYVVSLVPLSGVSAVGPDAHPDPVTDPEPGSVSGEETHPRSGSDRPVTDPEPGSKHTPAWGRNTPQAGPPTEKTPEKPPEHACVDPIDREAHRRLQAKKRRGEDIRSDEGLLVHLRTEVAAEFDRKRRSALDGAKNFGRSRVGISTREELTDELQQAFGDDEHRRLALATWEAGHAALAGRAVEVAS